MNFDKSTVRLHYLCIFFMLAKFWGNQRLIAMSSINFLNSSFYSLKYYVKDEFIHRMVNNIQLTWKLAWKLKTYRTYNSTMRFSKYELYYKLLVGVTLIRVILGVTWT